MSLRRGASSQYRVASLLLVACGLLATSGAGAALFSESGKGTAAGQFLKFGAGARAEGMGEAYTVLAQDATALYWNPAGLSSVEKWGLSLMHMVGVEETSFEYGAAAKRVGGGVLGVGVQAYSAGELVKTDVNGLETGTFTPMDLAISLGYGRKIEGFSVGVGAKFVSSKIVDTASGFGFDLGILSPTTMDGKLQFGFSAQNLAGSLSFGEVTESLPLAARLGSLFKPLESLNVALDIVLPSDNMVGGALGVEYNYAVSDSFK